jgi:hypothetical protein
MRLPTVLSPMKRTISRVDAKTRLNLPEDSILLVTIARAHKYVSHDGLSYPQSLLSVLQSHLNAYLLAVGPDQAGLWQEAAHATHGRVRALGTREDTALAYQAADVYIDSYPIVSITSLLEAGSYGTPLVSRAPDGADLSVLGADAPGLAGNLLNAHDAGEWHALIHGLLKNPVHREQLGAKTQHSIEALHVGEGWRRALQCLYQNLAAIPHIDFIAGQSDIVRADTVDLLLPVLYREEPTLQQIREFHLQLMPLHMRVSSWVDVRQSGTETSVGRLLPEWLGTSVERWRSRA